MKRRILAAFCSAIVVSLGLVVGASTTAGATGTMTVKISSPIQVTNKLMVSIPVQVVCDPLEGDTTVDRVAVQVQQANGKSVSSASGSVEGGAASPFRGEPFLTCDGTTVNTVVVNVVGNGPFHGGGAIVSASATHAVGSCTFFCQQTDSEFAGLGPVAMQMRG